MQCALGMLSLPFLFNLSNRLEGGVSSSQKIGLWRQKLSETKVLVHSQHLGNAAQKCTRASQTHLDFESKEFVFVDCHLVIRLMLHRSAALM